MPRSLLLALEDELDDLASVMNCLPELRMTARVMRDIAAPSSRRRGVVADRIGERARELFNERLEKHLSASGRAFVRQADAAMPINLAETSELITAAVQWRLYRLAALVRLLLTDR